MQNQIVKDVIKELDILIYEGKYKYNQLEKSFVLNPAELIIRDIRKQLLTDSINKLNNCKKSYEAMLISQCNKNIIYP